MHSSVEWHDNTVRILDQSRLPHEELYLELSTVEDVARAIEMKVTQVGRYIGDRMGVREMEGKPAHMALAYLAKSKGRLEIHSPRTLPSA